ncbi:MAG: hypothetical protein AAB514_03105 [Patescibacteria group bacterium]
MIQKNKKSKMTLDKLGIITQQGFLEVNERFSEVNEKFLGIDKRFSEVDREIGEVKRDVREMKENFSELFAKLDKFIALYEKQEQELLILGAQLRRLEERMAVLEKIARK